MANILLVDDDALLRDTLRQMLELDGHQVTEAENGQEGLRAFERSRSFDLVITDMLMPVLDGAQFIADLRRSRAEVPILAISGGRRTLTPQFSLDTAGLLGAVCQLSKPFDRSRLRTAVEQAMTARTV